MSARQRRKYIYSLKKHDGTLTWNHHEKEEILHDYFVNLMGTKKPRARTFNWDNLNLPRLVERQGVELDRPFSELEIQLAVKSLPCGKAPGPDGFTSEFYKSC
jgi:hypothetical protein